MGSLYERIEGMCKERGISITDMCRESKAPRGSLGDLKKGRIAKLSIDTLEKLSAYFSVPIEYILGTEEKPAANEGNGLSNDAVEMGRIFDAAVPEIKERMKEVAEGKATKRNAVNVVEVKCPLDGSAQKIYQNVVCVGSDAFPSDLNNGCEMYHPCQECELCRMRAMFAELKGFGKK